MKTKTALTLFLLTLTLLAADAQVKAPQDIPWYGNKFSMFIHYGLYSELGGIWQGREIHYGYSEQIQAHAGIYGDVYADLAYDFNLSRFDADSIAALAKTAGMRSIIITSKHHDGFCLWKTSTTDFNSYASPAGRDLIAELSDACHRAGLGFGLYFSLIDWHEPCADHITSHNATFITGPHHQFNLAQVEELVTKYGDISELWFDMGSLTPQQSLDLYELVRKHQPDCMISGRLGNGCYDFAVMSDNFYPERALQTPWQSAASMFNETWGYRSWQVRGDVSAKAREKLCSLLRVVSGGGNFLLNIGPEGDGSVVPFEREVLTEMGSWLSKNSDAVYSTSPSPFTDTFDWGCITTSGNTLNLILSGEKPSDNQIKIPVGKAGMISADGPAKVSVSSGNLVAKLSEDAYSGDIQVIRIKLDRPLNSSTAYGAGERIALSSYFCQDYYTNARSETGYRWNIAPKRTSGALTLEYTDSESGRKVNVDVDGEAYQIVLNAERSYALAYKPVKEKDRRILKTSKSTFDSPRSVGESYLEDVDGWINVEQYVDSQMLACRPFETLHFAETIESPEDQEIILEVGAGNGMELYVNGESIAKHLNPYRCTFNKEKIRVKLRKGENRVLLVSYNRFEKKVPWLLRVAEKQALNCTALPLKTRLKKGSRVSVTVTPSDAVTPHEDARLHNLKITL